MLPRKFAESTLDLISSSTLGNTKGLVVIAELGGHELEVLVERLQSGKVEGLQS